MRTADQTTPSTSTSAGTSVFGVNLFSLSLYVKIAVADAPTLHADSAFVTLSAAEALVVVKDFTGMPYTTGATLGFTVLVSKLPQRPVACQLVRHGLLSSGVVGSFDVQASDASTQYFARSIAVQSTLPSGSYTVACATADKLAPSVAFESEPFAIEQTALDYVVDAPGAGSAVIANAMLTVRWSGSKGLQAMERFRVDLWQKSR